MGKICTALLLSGCLLPGCKSTNVAAEKAQDSTLPEQLRIAPEFLDSGQIQVAQVSESAETQTVRTSGKVGFDEEHLSDVASPLVGRVIEIRAQPGEHVAAGQTLAVIDSADLGAASSEFIKARADLLLAERSQKLARELLAAKAMANKDSQKAEDDLVKAKADLRRTRERLTSLGVPEADLDQDLDALHVRSQFVLTAPIAGTVIERDLTLGQMVGGDNGQKLFVVADLETLWVTADIYEKDLSLIQRGEAVTVQTAAWPQDQFDGRIDYVSDTVDPTSRTIKVRVAVDNRRRLLKPEMFVTATVQTASTVRLLTIPMAAVHGEAAGQAYVFVALEGNRFVRRPVTLGQKVDDHVVVSAGLAAQDAVVTTGSILLKAEAERQANS